MRSILSETLALRMGLSAREYEAAVASLGPVIPSIRRQIENIHIPRLEVAALVSGTGVVTFGANFSLETPFTGVKLIFANYGASTTYANFAVAASANASSYTIASDGIGGLAPWTQGTVNGAASVVMPPGALNAPSLVVSDLIEVESIDPTDGGGAWHIKTRAANSSAGFSTGGCSFSSDTMPASIGRSWSEWFSVGDYVSTPANIAEITSDTMGSIATDQNAFAVLGVIFYSGTRCITLHSFGDSLTRGYGTESGAAGYGRIAATLAGSAKCAVSYCDGGLSGQITEGFAGRAMTMLNAGIIPHVLSIPIDSPNGYVASDRVNQELSVMAVIEKALSLNVLVVLLTSIPFGGSSADPNNATRIISSAKVRKLVDSGVMILDAASIMCGFAPTAAKPAVVPAQYISSTAALHFNTAGETLLANGLKAILQAVIAEN